MASFGSLPQELIDSIVQLAVEDADALDHVELRRFILLQLALVSKVFISPSRKALWAIIEYADFTETLMNVLNAGVGKDLVVSRVSYCQEDESSIKSREPHYRLTQFLKNVKGVIELVFPEGSRIVDVVPGIFHISSTQFMKHLTVYGVRFGLNETMAPTLHSLNWSSKSNLEVLSGNDNPFLKLLEDQPTSSITAFSFTNLTSDHYFLHFYCMFEIHGANTKSLRFCFVDFDIIPFILCQMTSLKSLALYDEDMADVCSLLNCLDFEVRLEILELSQLIFPVQPYDTSTNSDFLLGLLNSLATSRLKSLICNTRREFTRFDSIIEFEEFEEVRDDLLLKYTFYVEQCRRKGIELMLWTQEGTERYAELKKQKMYQERQEELDALNFVHV